MQKGKCITILGDSIIGRIRKKTFNKCIKANASIYSLKELLAQDMFSYVQSILNRGTLDLAVLHVGTNDLVGRDGQKNMQWRLQIQFWNWVKTARTQDKNSINIIKSK